MSTARLEMQQLTAAGSNNRYPDLDARQHDALRFSPTAQGTSGIWWQAADGTGRGQPADGSGRQGESHIPESWSADDTLLYSVTRNGPGVAVDHAGPKREAGRSAAIRAIDVDRSHERRLFARRQTGRVHPDGARRRRPSASSRFPATRRQSASRRSRPISPKHPRWSPDGKRLFYDPRIGDFESVSVDDATGTLSFGDPRTEQYHPFQLAPPGRARPTTSPPAASSWA